MDSAEDKIGFFQAVTGADHETAEHVLEAHGWDLNRGVNFYMESSAAPAYEGQDAHAARFELPLPGHESDDNTGVEHPPPPPPAAPQVEDSQVHAIEDEGDAADDAALTAALTASLRTENGEDEAPLGRNGPSSRRNGWASDGDDEDDDDEDFIPRQSNSFQERGHKVRSTSGRQRSQRGISIEDFPETRVRRNRPRGAAAPDPIMGFLGGNRIDASGNGNPGQEFGGVTNGGSTRDWPPPLLVDGRIPDNWAENNSSRLKEESDIPHMPEGINVEEARMLEAALLGIPYEGTIPDFSQFEPAEPMSPSVMQGRKLRQEQDQAYLDSLQADKIKADTAEAERRAADEVSRREQEARESAAEAERDYQRELEEKALSLPVEPPAGDPDAITVLIRGPKGQKFGRRFRRSDPCSSLFSFVDVSGAPDFRAGHYKLVTQFPQRAFESSREGTLQDVGLTQKQEALFLELP